MFCIKKALTVVSHPVASSSLLDRALAATGRIRRFCQSQLKRKASILTNPPTRKRSFFENFTQFPENISELPSQFTKAIHQKATPYEILLND
jgi:hypothetical protein